MTTKDFAKLDTDGYSLVSIVLPIFNEEPVLPELFSRLDAALEPLSTRFAFEYVAVDDGSRDNSLRTMRGLFDKHPRLRIVELRRNYGQTPALQAGLDVAQGDVIITMDADLQHFPEEIPSFLAKIEEGYDLVCGWRHQRQEGIERRLPSKIANAILRKISGLEIHDIGTTFRAYRREIIQDLRIFGDQHRFIPALAAHAGAKICEIKIENIERPVGESNYGLSRTINVFLDMFFLFFFMRYFDKPIRLFGAVSFGFFAPAVAILATMVVYSFATDTPLPGRSGWFTLSMFLLIAALQNILIGILAEILIRVYYSSRHNSSYRIRREWKAGSEGVACVEQV